MSAYVRSLMTAAVVSIRADASLADAARVLANHSFSALPIVDADDVPIGIVSEIDLMRLLLTGASAPVRDFMSTPVEVVDELAAADDVIHRMRARRIHHRSRPRSARSLRARLSLPLS